jgi:hypothetical protein
VIFTRNQNVVKARDAKCWRLRQARIGGQRDFHVAMLIPDPRHLDRQLLVGQIPSRADGSSAHGPVIAPLEHTGRRSVLQLESELQALFPDSKGGDRRRRRFLRTVACAERTRQRPDFDRFAEQQRRRARRASGPLRAQVGTRLTQQSTATENRTKSGGNSVRQLTSIPSRRSPPALRIAAPTNRICRVVCTAFGNASRSVATPYPFSTTY